MAYSNVTDQRDMCLIYIISRCGSDNFYSLGMKDEKWKKVILGTMSADQWRNRKIQMDSVDHKRLCVYEHWGSPDRAPLFQGLCSRPQALSKDLFILLESSSLRSVASCCPTWVSHSVLMIAPSALKLVPHCSEGYINPFHLE